VLVLGGLGFGDAGGNQRDRVFPRLRRGFEGVSDAAVLVGKAELVGEVELAAEAELVAKAELVAEVELLDAKSPEVKLQPEGRFSFAATVGTNNQKFEVDLELFGAIDVVNKGQLHTALVLEKAEKGVWSRLLKAEGDQAEASEANSATAGANSFDAKNIGYLRDVQDAARLVDVIAALKGSTVDARVVERRAGAGQGRGGVAEFSVRASGEERCENFGQDSEWSEKILAAIVEVILKNLLKQKTEGSAADKLNVRLKAVALLGRLFALPGRQFTQEHPLVFAEFLKRFSNVVDVRVAVVNGAKAFMEANPNGEQASKILGDRLLDYDDKVCVAVVKAI
jgi:hypothetical protein